MTRPLLCRNCSRLVSSRALAAVTVCEACRTAPRSTALAAMDAQIARARALAAELVRRRGGRS